MVRRGLRSEFPRTRTRLPWAELMEVFGVPVSSLSPVPASGAEAHLIAACGTRIPDREQVMSLGPRCLEAQPHPPLAARRQGGLWSPGQAPASWELRSARQGWQRGATLLPTLVSRRAGPPGGVIQRTLAVCSRHRISRIVERNTVERKVRLGHFSFCVSALKAQETGPRVTWGPRLLPSPAGPCSAAWPRSHWAQPAGLPGLGALC